MDAKSINEGGTAETILPSFYRDRRIVFFIFGCVKGNCDFRTLLICAEGARLLQEDGTGETPQAL